MNPFGWSVALTPDHWDAMTWATIVIAVLAGIQVYREIRGAFERRKSIRLRLRAEAWMARRSCEVTLRSAPGAQGPIVVAKQFTSSPSLDRLQAGFREVLALSSQLSSDEARHGEEAFAAFLLASDQMNEIVRPSTPATAKVDKMGPLCEKGLDFLYDAVVALERLAGRREQEPALPLRASLRDIWFPPDQAKQNARGEVDEDLRRVKALPAGPQR